MPTNKRITDLTDYTSVLPYASEMFGVYQPMIGWKSKRLIKRLMPGLIDSQNALLKAFAKNYQGISEIDFSETDCFAKVKNIQVGKLAFTELSKNNISVLIQTILDILPKDKAPAAQDWSHFINPNILEKFLTSSVADYYSNTYKEQCIKLHDQNNLNYRRATYQNDVAQMNADIQRNENDLVSSTQRLINEESAMAGALLDMVNQKMFLQLESIFYNKPSVDVIAKNQQIADMLQNNDDPFATFDPKKDIKNVSLSPLGIVHLFREYFFELDTFLGTPMGMCG